MYSSRAGIGLLFLGAMNPPLRVVRTPETSSSRNMRGETGCQGWSDEKATNRDNPIDELGDYEGETCRFT
jgi:hypothetical protein